MDNPRLFLWIGVALLAWMNVIQWNRDYGAPAAAAQATATESAPAASAPAAPVSQLPALPTQGAQPAPAATPPSHSV